MRGIQYSGLSIPSLVSPEYWIAAGADHPADQRPDRLAGDDGSNSNFKQYR
jgi:hypothetical protein